MIYGAYISKNYTKDSPSKNAFCRSHKIYLEYVFVDEEGGICKYVYSNGSIQTVGITDQITVIQKGLWIPYESCEFLYDNSDIVSS